MVRLDSEEWIPKFFVITLVIVICITIFCAVFQTSIFGLAAEFPPEHGIMTAVMGGQGCGGIFACVVNLVTLGKISTRQILRSKGWNRESPRPIGTFHLATQGPTVVFSLGQARDSQKIVI